MISVMNEFEIDRNSTSAPNPSFFVMESPKEEESMDPIDPEISQSLYLPVKSQDLEEARVRVSPAGDSPRSPTGVSERNEAPLDMNGFVIGDMVWGKVKSHPWWPGHIFNESFASPAVRRTKRDGFVLVAFFGDSSYGWFDPAELIPYEPTFVEKSKQTPLRSFVRAVEESIDESSRRAALALSCRCRNPYNFRPTKNPNYFEVDVVGYERNGIYSKRQINNERDSFDPKDALDFLCRLAVTPEGGEAKDLEWHRNVARALALRTARYEEFDETYAQAFGQQLVRPARDEMGVPEQAERFAPRVAPLSGPLVFAESLGNRKKSVSKLHSSSSSSAHKDRDRSSKKNKYVLKRRDEHLAAAAAASSPTLLPDAYFAQKQQPSFTLSDSPATDSSSANEYVLQKVEDTKLTDDDERRPESPQTPPVPGAAFDGNVGEKPAAVLPPLKAGAVVVKKENKIKKRSLEDVNNQEEAKLMKKKKKKKKYRDGFGLDFPSVFKKTAAARPSSTSDTEATGASETSVAPPPRPASPPTVDLGPLDQLDLPSAIADLTALALNPFYGVECNTQLITRRVFLRFRSLVYSKSLAVPAPEESDVQGQEAVQASKPAAAANIAPPSSVKEAKEQQQQRDQASSSSKPSKFMKRPDDPTKAGRKRAPSDRQEEISAKRLNKLSKLKSPASEKKAGIINHKSSDGPKGSNGGATTTAPPAAVAPAPPAAKPPQKPEKQELPPPLLSPPPPKRESPTYLVIRFPPRSTLPSVSNLKARFARFGPLEVNSTRVFWKSHSCRVQFKYKPDAMRALSYVKSNDIFGQIQVDYSIKDVEAPAPELTSEQPPSSRRLEAQVDGSLQFRPGNGSGSLSVAQPRSALPQGKLKSILKKPGEEAGKENQRVKFMLAGNGGSSSSQADSPPATSSAGGGAVGFADVAPPQPQPQPRQTLPQPSLPPPARSYEPNHFAPPPRPVENRAPPAVQFSEAQKYGGGGGGGGGETEGNSRSNVDISHQMLSLLLRCNDIVTGLRALPDFVPYRPL